MDDYKTILKDSQGEYKEKGSRFIAYAERVDDHEQFEVFLEKIKSLHHKARHHCWAYRVEPEEIIERQQDDGEPSGSAGLPILNQIRSFELLNVGVIVVRYFGGTKLGVSGLIRAYKSATELALENAEVYREKVLRKYQIAFNYNLMPEVMSLLNWEEVIEIKKELTAHPSVFIGLPPSIEENMLTKMAKVLSGVPVDYDVEVNLQGADYTISKMRG